LLARTGIVAERHAFIDGERVRAGFERERSLDVFAVW